tara:strand:- start:11355 stop:11966 length:612 start_codon:yes stop_codon:yes gene_type:complete
MTMRLASDIVLRHGTLAVTLTPSLRAATLLERLHGGFPALLEQVQAFNVTTIIEIIKTAGQAPDALLMALSDAPLRTIRDVTYVPIVQLLLAFGLISDDTDTDTTPKPAPSGNPIAWPDLFAQLYKIATGWLGWTPATAWAATVQEINEAFHGLVERIKATSGTTAEDEAETTISAEQRQQNEALGLDPEFDRAGLHSLRARL